MSASLRENLQALYDLQQIDSQLQRQKRAQSALDNGAKAAQDAVVAGSALKANLAQQHVAQGELKDSELKLATLEAKVKSYHQKLYQGTVTSAKELASIEREIESLGRHRSDLDTRILDLMDQVEQRQTETVIAQATSDAAEAHSRTISADFRSKYDALTLELTDLTRRRADAVGAVEDKKLLARYEEIRAHSAGVGIAKIVESNCGGCHMTLPSGLVKSVRDAIELQVCDNCGRILAP